MNVTPVSLLQRLRQPDEFAAWERFVELYSPLLYHWAKQLGQQESDTADLVQDVFLLLFRKLPAFEYNPQKSFRAWLKTLLLNQHRARLRRRVPFTLEDSAYDVPDAGDDEREEQEYRRYLVQRALQLIRPEFSPVLWQAFEEYALAGRSPPTIAQELGISPGTVYTSKSKVLYRLRQELRDLLD